MRAFQETNQLESTGEINEETAALIQQKVMEHVRNAENDQQLQTAIELITQQARQS